MLKVIILTLCASLALANVQQQALRSQPSPVDLQATKDEAEASVVNPLVVNVLKHLEHDYLNLQKRVEKLEHVEETGADVEDTGADVEDTGADVEDTGADVEDTGADVEDTDANNVATGAGVEVPTTLLQEKTTKKCTYSCKHNCNCKNFWWHPKCWSC